MSGRLWPKGTRVCDLDMPHRQGTVMGYHRTLLASTWYVIVRWDGETNNVYMRAVQLRAVA